MNARQMWPEVQFVEYVMADDERLMKYEGVYSIQNVPLSSESSYWSEGQKRKLLSSRVEAEGSRSR